MNVDNENFPTRVSDAATQLLELGEMLSNFAVKNYLPQHWLKNTG